MCITNYFKSVLAGFGMLLLAFNVSAYPQLTFDGAINYSYTVEFGGQFDVQGTLTGSQDINSPLQLPGSKFNFSGLLDSVSTNPGSTLGTFTGTHLSVIDGGLTPTTFLSGWLLCLLRLPDLL